MASRSRCRRHAGHVPDPLPADLWTVYSPGRGPEQRQMHYLQVVGRLKPGATREQAHADMAGIAAHIAAISPATNKGWGVTIEPLRDALVGSDLGDHLARPRRHRRLRPADGVRQCREPPPCQGRRPHPRDRRARRARRAPRAHPAATGDREPAPRGDGGVAGLALSAAAIRLAPSFMPAGTLPPGIALALDLRVAAFAVLLTLCTGACPDSRPPGTPARCRCRRRLPRAAARPRAGRGWSDRRSPSSKWLSRWCCWPAPGC